MNENPNAKAQMSNQIQNPRLPNACLPARQGGQANDKKYDLAERTARFGEDVIDFVRILPETQVNRPLVSQLVRSGTSIGANYMEADAAESKKDFQHKIGISKKEAKETLHWLRMIAKANSARREECRKLYREAHELTLIFSAIIRGKKR